MLCSRPHERFVDFETSRFVVSKGCGLDLGNRMLEFGEEVPRGALDARALRRLYERPLCRIELLEHAYEEMPELREACARRGVSPTPPEDSGAARQRALAELEPLSRTELARMAKANGLSPDGNKQQLRERLADLAR